MTGTPCSVSCTVPIISALCSSSRAVEERTARPILFISRPVGTAPTRHKRANLQSRANATISAAPALSKVAGGRTEQSRVSLRKQLRVGDQATQTVGGAKPDDIRQRQVSMWLKSPTAPAVRGCPDDPIAQQLLAHIAADSR